MSNKPTAIVWAMLAAAVLWASVSGNAAAGWVELGAGPPRPAGPAEAVRIPPGTQARALVSDIPPTERILAGQLISAERLRELVLLSKSLDAVPNALQVALRKGLAGYVSARPVGPAGSTWVAVDVRECKDSKTAVAVARAAAEAFAEYVHEHERQGIERELARLQAEENDLRKELERLRREAVDVRAATPAAGMQERGNLVAIKLQMLARMLLEAQIIQAQAEANLRAHQERIKAGRTEHDPDVRRAMQADPVLKRLNLQLAELQVELGDLPATTTAPHPAAEAVQKAMQSVQRQIDRRHATVLTNALQAAGQMKQMAVAAATRQLQALTERLARVKAEARDLEVAMGRIGALADEAGQVAANIAKLERRKLELRVRRRQEPGKSESQFKVRAVFPVP